MSLKYDNYITRGYSYYTTCSLEHDIFCKENEAISYDFDIHIIKIDKQKIIDLFSDFFGSSCEIYSLSGCIFFKTKDILFSISGEENSTDYYSKELHLIASIIDQKYSIDQLKNLLYREFEKFIIPDSNRPEVNLLFVNKLGDLSSVEKPIRSKREFNPSFYPILGDNPSKFIDDYINSSEPILILTGEAGMGKSSLICEIIKRISGKKYVVYDHEAMTRDDLYIEALYNYGKSTLILEDAEIIMQSREEDRNPAMARILNMSDGIISNEDIKIIMTANISDKNKMDSALLRPGRCFALVEFKPFTYEEALKAANSIGKELYEEKDSYTAAEIYNSKETVRKDKPNKIGFR